jgi:hypothetical protein
LNTKADKTQAQSKTIHEKRERESIEYRKRLTKSDGFWVLRSKAEKGCGRNMV